LAFFLDGDSIKSKLVATGKSTGCPAGRAVTDSSTGVKVDPVIISAFPGSHALVGGELYYVHPLIRKGDSI